MKLRALTRLRREHTIFVMVVLLVQSPVYAGRSDLIVHTEKGRVRGIRFYLPSLSKNVEAYLGIPFAKPPVGHLRFKHPEPIEKWNGIYNATKLPNSCYQTPDEFFGDFYGSTMWNPTTRISEDCLYVNVWVPKGERKLKRSAVLVWIYGGGFYSGTSTLNLYDGKILAAVNDLIVVSINYRVGALGYLALNHHTAPGNAGMFDQLMGLEWVQRNIHYFGGDPKNVTLFGESAGSVSVSLHLLSPLSRSKFQRVIMQSGTANMPWGTLTMPEAKRRSLELAIDYLGCPRDGDMEEISECLRAIPPQTLVNEQWVSRGIIQFPFVPVIDGTFLVEHPDRALERGSFKKCPILLGSNLNEGSYFLVYELVEYLSRQKYTMNREQFEKSINHLFFFYPQYPHPINTFGQDAINFQYSDFLDPESTGKNVEALDNAVGDCHFVCHVNKFAEYYAKAGENVYYYYFTERYRSNPWPQWMGVLHGDEIIFVFGDPLKPGYNYTKEERDLSLKIMHYWTNFAKTGDPNRAPARPPLGEWPQHTPRGREYLELNSRFLHETDKSLSVGRGPRSTYCAFWTNYLPQLVSSTSNMTEAEIEWKRLFHEWSTKYIIDWKIAYEAFKHNQEYCDECRELSRVKKRKKFRKLHQKQKEEKGDDGSSEDQDDEDSKDSEDQPGGDRQLDEGEDIDGFDDDDDDDDDDDIEVEDVVYDIFLDDETYTKSLYQEANNYGKDDRKPYTTPTHEKGTKSDKT